MRSPGLLIALLLLLWGTGALGNALNVPADYATIQAAIDAANPGDEVVVQPGTYHELIDFKGKAITVRSTDPLDPAVVAATIIDGQDLGTVVKFQSSEGAGSVLRGLTIREGKGIGGGLYINGSPTVEYNVIQWNNSTQHGGGILVQAGSPTVQHNTVAYNVSAEMGGGLCVLSQAAPVITMNTIHDNIGHGGGGVAFKGACASLVFEGNTLQGNSGGLKGGGLYCTDATVTLIKANEFISNTADFGGGIACLSQCAATIEDNTIRENEATDFGGGIYLQGECAGVIRGNTIRQNLAGCDVADGGGGIACRLSSVPLIEDNTIVENEAGCPGNGGGVLCDESAPHLLRNTIADNRATGDYAAGGGICVYSTGHLPAHVPSFVIEGNTIRDNVSDFEGGGIWCHVRDVAIEANIITGNTAASDGGGAYLGGSPADFAHNVVAGNTAGLHGGGLCAFFPTGSLASNTFSGNGVGPGGEGGGLYLYLDAPLAITNSIVAFSTSGGGVFCTGVAANITYCDVYGNAGGDYVGEAPCSGSGCLSRDPLFADAENGDFHLKSCGGRWTPGDLWVIDTVHSPCIDAGDPFCDHSLEPEPNGDRVNMGAYGNTPQASKSGTFLDWAGTSGYETDGVDPDAGDPDSATFTFRVKYTDPTGAPPSLAKCLVQRRDFGAGWHGCATLALAKESGDIATGAVYSGSTQLPNVTLKYCFRFRSGGGRAVVGEPNTWLQGPLITAVPRLGWTGATGFEADGVSPDSGPMGTTFQFKVLYADSAGDEPTVHQLAVRRNGSPWRTQDMTPASGGDHRLGKVYQTSLKIDQAGNYRYRFTFADGSGNAVGSASGWNSGPTIGGGSAMLTSVAAIPAPAGAQITFALSAEAKVSVSVFNLAGRPIRTIATGKDCASGPNTIVWTGLSDSGVAVPSGRYVVTMRACAADGTQSTAMTMAQIVR
jgi:parallel beta-helix repeat protein